MITSRSDYYYVGGDISNVTINGEIMPLRNSVQQKILRGEDPCFLVEAGLERIGWWREFRNATSGSSVWVDNPRLPDSVSFTKKVTKYSSSSACGIDMAKTLLDEQIYDVYNYRQSGTNVFTAGFLSALPTIGSTPFSANADFESIAQDQGILLESYTFDGFGSALNKTPVLQLFTAMNRARYSYISIPHSRIVNDSVTAYKTSTLKWPLHMSYRSGNTSMGSFTWSSDRDDWVPVTGGIAYYHFMHEIFPSEDVVWSAVGDSDYEDIAAVFTLTGFAQGGTASYNAYCLASVNGSYAYDCTFSDTNYQRTATNTSSGRMSSVTNKVLLSSDASRQNQNALYVYQPHLDEDWMKTWALRCGGEWYDESSTTDHQAVCDYTFTPDRTIIVFPVTRTIY